MSLLLASPVTMAADGNVVPDALTRATTWNTYTGDLAFLYDGKVPDVDPDARAFLWEGGGILVFEWDEPLALEKVRIYIGEIGNNYRVRAYLGGRLDESGAIREPEGVRTALLADDSRSIGRWVEVRFPEGTLADNIELVALGTIVFYEIEIHALGTGTTAIEVTSWARMKKGSSSISGRSRIP